MNYAIQKITDKKSWDAFVINHAPQSYFQSWDWGEVEQNSGAKIWRLSIVDDQSSIYSVSQINKVQAKRGTFLHVRHGPIFKEWKKEYFDFWLSGIKNLALKEKASFIRISPLIKTKYEEFLSEFSFRSAPIHSMDAEIVSVIEVNKSESELLSAMRKNTRYAIRKGVSSGVTVRKSTDITIFNHLYKQTVARHDFVPHSAIEIEFKQFTSSGNSDLFISSYNDRPIAAAIISYFGNQAIYRHGASIQSKIPATYVLQWEIIKEVKKRKLPFYNLFGIADSDRLDHPWRGLTIFKKGFGGETKQYLHAHDLPLNWRYGINYAVELARKKKRNY